jgi:hypothetical protein
MGELIGDASGLYSTWGKLRRPIVTGGHAIDDLTQHSRYYQNGAAYHAGWKDTNGFLFPGSWYKFPPAIDFGVGSGGSYYFYSNFFTGVGGNTENSIDESVALALVGESVTLQGGTTFVISANYKNTLNGQVVFPPVPPPGQPTSSDIDTVGLLTAFNS